MGPVTRITRWIAARRLQKAARRYQERLGPQLRADYGRSEAYTPEQIAHSAQRAKLPLAYIALGYAGFMSEAAFASLLPGSAAEYDALRTRLARYARRNPTSAGFEPADENSDAFVGSRDATSAPWP
jgi:hypothetical protein